MCVFIVLTVQIVIAAQTTHLVCFYSVVFRALSFGFFQFQMVTSYTNFVAVLNGKFHFRIFYPVLCSECLSFTHKSYTSVSCLIINLAVFSLCDMKTSFIMQWKGSFICALIEHAFPFDVKDYRSCTAVNGSHSCRVSLVIWNHTVLPSTRCKWTHPALNPLMWSIYVSVSFVLNK